MVKHYPIALDLVDKAVLVVGGGDVAERKVRSLLAAGAKITVVSPELTLKLQELAEEDLIFCEKRNYQTDDIEGNSLVIGATNVPAVNKQVAEEALERNLLVNVIDQPELSNFNVPAVIRHGSLCLSISTDGKSPALSRRIRKELEQKFGPEYGDFLDLMGNLRSGIITEVADEDERKQIFRELAYSEAINHLKKGNYKQAEDLINDILPEQIEINLSG